VKTALNIFRPWFYFRITPYTKDKLTIDLILPSLFALVCVIFVKLVSNDCNSLFNVDSGLPKLATFVATLPGFYLAALAAIATFNKPSMDEALLGTPLFIIDANGNEIQLSRRRFLSAMFACLTAQAFVFVLLVNFFNLINYSFLNTLPELIVWALGFLCFFIFWQLLLITLWGLFYLGEKIHT
jgi:hypothetical protein